MASEKPLSGGVTEFCSLPSAFLQAGFAGVLASLWSVDERSTSQLMDCFYRLWLKEGAGPSFRLAEGAAIAEG